MEYLSDNWLVLLTMFGLGFGCCAIVRSFAEPDYDDCPRCDGIAGYETAPGDWHDCEYCNAVGKIQKR